MKAIQYRRLGGGPELVEIDRPRPGPGQILLRVTAAGLCHSDTMVMGLSARAYRYGFPLTLGHEAAGVVAALGADVTGVAIGTSHLVYGPWGCGNCTACAGGRENYCSRAESLGIRAPGLGAPGALAEYMLVDSARHLVPIGDLDPVDTVPLTDAGLTPYHAIKRSIGLLVPGSNTVVIGAGGLGLVAIALLRATTATRVLAVDVSDEKLFTASTAGAHVTVISDPGAALAIREQTAGEGAQLVLDFVGTDETLALATRSVAVDGDVTLVGMGGGTASIAFFKTPFGARVGTTYWGSRTELLELVALARSGALRIAVEKYSLDDAPLAYQRLHDGRIRGRAVVVP